MLVRKKVSNLDCVVLQPRFLSSVCYTFLARKIEPRIGPGWEEVHFTLTVVDRIVKLGFGEVNTPSNASKRDVFPEPVGPQIMLKLPRLKTSSESILSRNFLPEGVEVPVDLPDQEKVALLNPIITD